MIEAEEVARLADARGLVWAFAADEEGTSVLRIAVIGAGPMERLHARAVSRRARAVGCAGGRLGPKCGAQ